ncbi:unnamed protein product [Cuscuta campestris]|uniref:Auxin-responsive protein n=1 Tax=Cuscuta campestris TaxID=132261 RepID=A0A484MX25_9ASTE|nr:unnamed protein product [Cuscuta campestris]
MEGDGARGKGGGGGGKVTGIRHIVRLKEILHKWHNVTLGHKAAAAAKREGRPLLTPPLPPPPPPAPCGGGISPAICKRLMMAGGGCSQWDSDEESCASPNPPAGIPRGYLAVYVGPERRRFIVPTSYLGDPLFKVLLEKVEEEFGFDHGGALTIPCETETFKYLLKCMETHEREQQLVDPQQHPAGSCCGGGDAAPSHTGN